MVYMLEEIAESMTPTGMVAAVIGLIAGGLILILKQRARNTCLRLNVMSTGALEVDAQSSHVQPPEIPPVESEKMFFKPYATEKRPLETKR